MLQALQATIKNTWMLSSPSLARDQEGVCSECSIGYFCQQQTAAKSAHGIPRLVTTDCALEALCPRGGASGDYTYERSMAIAEALRRIGEQLPVLFCSDDVPNCSVRKWTVIQGLLAELAARWEKVGEDWADLHQNPDDLAVVDLEKCQPLFFFIVRFFRDAGDVAPLLQEGITSARTSMT